MAKKLSEDQIKWILSLDVSEAEEGYHKLRQENKQLEERNKEVKKSLRELEKAGKQTGEAYTRLSAELAENNKKLATNREMTKKLSLQMGVTNMTMTQLKRHAADLHIHIADHHHRNAVDQLAHADGTGRNQRIDRRARYPLDRIGD